MEGITYQSIKGFENQAKRAVYSLGKIFTVRPRSYLEGARICRTLRDHGIPSTLGKFSKAGDNPNRIVLEYKRASDILLDDNYDNLFYLSLKPPAFQFDLECVSSITERALKNNQLVHLDSHDHILAEPTIKLLSKLIDRFGTEKDIREKCFYGLTLPSRWKRSLVDAQWVIKNGVIPRLVKGEFKAKLVSEEMDPKKGFLTLIDLLAGHVPEIALATHDCELAGEAITQAKKQGVEVQLELLFGMPCSGMIALSKKMAVPVRFYVPYGETLTIYGIQHFLKNPHKILRPGFTELFSSCTSKLEKVISLI